MDVFVDRKFSEKNTHPSVNGQIRNTVMGLLLGDLGSISSLLSDLGFVFFLNLLMGLITFLVIVRTHLSPAFHIMLGT